VQAVSPIVVSERSLMLFPKSAQSGSSQASTPHEDLDLRAVTVADISRIALLAGDWDVARMTGRIPYPYDENGARQWIENLAPGEFVAGIILNEVLIGICGFMPLEDKASCAEIGYWIGKPYWGQGFATHAVRVLVDMAFEEDGIKRLTAGHFTDNPASGRVLEKLGFKQVGPSICWCEARARDIDALQYELKRPAQRRWGRE